MKSLIVVLAALAVSTAAFAASPEQGYIAARDKYLARFKPYEEKVPDKVSAEEELARKDLARQLGHALGPVGVKGFAGEGTLNLLTLFPESEDSDAIDGLVFKSADAKAEKSEVLLTTRLLIEDWVRRHHDTLVNNALEMGSQDPIKQVLFEKASKAHDAQIAAWLAQHKEVAQDVAGTITSERFYAQMFSFGAAVMKYADIAVPKPANATSVYAALIGRQQDIGPYPPEEIVVTLVQGERIYVLRAKPETAIQMIPECTAVWDAVTKQRDAALQEKWAKDKDSKAKGSKAQDSKTKDAKAKDSKTDDADDDKPVEIENAGDKAFHRCFAEKAKTAAFYPALQRQVQALVDRVGAP